MDRKDLSNSLWHDRNSRLWRFICPLCKAERCVPFKPRPDSFRHFFQIALTSVVCTLVTWKWLGWKGIVCFVPLWTLFEVFYRWRTRAALGCPRCGFDPYLLMIDSKWAWREIDTFWRKKFADRGIPYPTSGKNSVSRAPNPAPDKSP